MPLTYGPRRILLQPGRAQSAQAFSDPLSIPTAILWLDAGSGTYSDTGLTTPQTTNGGAVAGWASRTRTNDVIQGAAGVTLVTAALNGRSVLRFNGTGYLKSAALAASEGQPNTIFVVAKKRLDDNLSQWPFQGRVTNTADRNSVGYNTTANSVRMYAGSTFAKGSVTRTNFNIFGCRFNGSASSFWVNGGTPSTGNPNSQALTGFAIGADGDGTSGLDGDIAEIVVYAGGLLDAQVAQVGGYLATKFGLTWT